jgi:hypothetical protein
MTASFRFEKSATSSGQGGSTLVDKPRPTLTPHRRMASDLLAVTVATTIVLVLAWWPF